MSVIEIPHVFAQQLELIFLLSISIWLVKPQLYQKCSTPNFLQWKSPIPMNPPKHPKMIIFSRKNLWLLGTTILGNPHIPNQRKEAINYGFLKGRNRKKTKTSTPGKTKVSNSKKWWQATRINDFPAVHFGLTFSRDSPVLYNLVGPGFFPQPKWGRRSMNSVNGGDPGRMLHKYSYPLVN